MKERGARLQVHGSRSDKSCCSPLGPQRLPEGSKYPIFEYLGFGNGKSSTGFGEVSR